MISKEKNNISDFDEEKYLQIISNEEKKDNLFNNFAEDFFCSEENVVDELCNKIENGNKYKKILRVLIYVVSALIFFGTHILLDSVFMDQVDYVDALISAIIYTVLILFMNKKQ